MATSADGLAWQIFASYSPAEVVLRYADMANPKPPEAPEQEDFESAVGFVDVSGFTALSEKLHKEHGKRGAELLNQCAPSTNLNADRSISPIDISNRACDFAHGRPCSAI